MSWSRELEADGNVEQDGNLNGKDTVKGEVLTRPNLKIIPKQCFSPIEFIHRAGIE